MQKAEPKYISLIKAKFEPPTGKCLVFIDGDIADPMEYGKHFSNSYGVALSTRLSNDYTHLNERVKGYEIISLGINFGGEEELIFGGQLDAQIDALATFILSMPDKIFFIRLGYEFDDFAQYRYSRQPFLIAYKHIHIMLEESAADQIAFVWQSSGLGTYTDLLDEWYPGNRWVDWVGFSFYDPRNVNHPILEFARNKKKPVLIGNSGPLYLDHQSNRLPVDTKQLNADIDVWTNWYAHYFDLIKTNEDFIKGISYHNGAWKSRPDWGPNFDSLNGSLHIDPTIKQKWGQESNQGRYIVTLSDIRQ